EVLKLPLKLPDTESVRQRRIDLERLLGNALLLVSREGREGSHVVEAVSQLDQNDTNVLCHGEEHLSHVFGPERLIVHASPIAPFGALFGAKPLHLAEFRDAVHQTSDFCTKTRLDLADLNANILWDVVQQRGGDGRNVKVQFGNGLG